MGNLNELISVGWDRFWWGSPPFLCWAVCRAVGASGAVFTREQYYPKLSKHLNCEYVKNDDKIYDKLKPMYKTAIRNAKKMLKAHEITVPSKCCPGTTVYEIFEYLKPYIDDRK